MTTFAMPISSHMTVPVVTIDQHARLAEAHQLMQDRRISCLAVTAAERAVGVLSRTDLLRVGRYETRARADGNAPPLLTFPPDRKVDMVMKREVVALPPSAAVSAAAQTMVQRRIHRVFVMDGEALTGVFSTKDLLVAIREQRVATAIAEVMSKPAYTIPLAAPLSAATDQLEKAHVSGLCVVDESDWPVGSFTQTEALAARDLPASTPVEEVMSYAMLCLDLRTPLYRAAAYAHATRARRILAVEGRQVQGVLTGIDFARAVSAG
jgi:CBS domain-containing protein